MHKRTANTSAMEIDLPTLSAILVAVGGVLATIFTGFWQWMSGRGKSSLDAHAAVINGFILLLAEFKTERVALVLRISNLELENHALSRHIVRLERAMRQANIDIPNGEPS